MGRIIHFAALSIMVSCGNASREYLRATDTTIATVADSLPHVDTPVVPDSTLRRFLVSEPGTYGWRTEAESVSLDFFPDGRLHIQGPDGEATMWEGAWRLNEGVLAMDRKDLGVEESFRVVIDGDSLRLGDRVYVRYRP